MKMKEQLGAIRKMKPMVHLSSEELPELKDWKVGGKYKVELELEQMGMENMDGMMDEECEDCEEGSQFKGQFIIKKAKAL